MKIVGLTGGIGSGKTSVAKEFESLGIAVFIADKESKKLLFTNEKVIDAVRTLLGNDSYITNDKGLVVPDTKFIASKVFNNKMLLNSLNQILHPAVRTFFKKWILDQKSPYIIYEAAILFETKGHLSCDHVITITAPLEERIRRVMKRDKVTRKDVESRLHNQWSDAQRLELSDFVIINEDFHKTRRFVLSIHEVLLKN
ncbi:MAG: dephospho-CoA kinase [Nonlabens sp.]|uniref:dephospho-CoA kinase n=1 Tax=Nonlabens sp. TaxID=1888209 RepID=UPI00321B72A9